MMQKQKKPPPSNKKKTTKKCQLGEKLIHSNVVDVLCPQRCSGPSQVGRRCPGAERGTSRAQPDSQGTHASFKAGR